MRGANNPHPQCHLKLNNRTLLRSQAVTGFIQFMELSNAADLDELVLRIRTCIATKTSNEKSNSAHSTYIPDEEPTSPVKLGSDTPNLKNRIKDDSGLLPSPQSQQVTQRQLSKPSINQVKPMSKLASLVPQSKAEPFQKANPSSKHGAELQSIKLSDTKQTENLRSPFEISGKIIHRVDLRKVKPKTLGARRSNTELNSPDTIVTEDLPFQRPTQQFGRLFNAKETFNRVIFSRDIKLTHYLSSSLSSTDAGQVFLEFELWLNRKITASCQQRSVHLMSPVLNFEQERAELMEKTQLLRARTMEPEILLTRRPLLNSREETATLVTAGTHSVSRPMQVEVDTYLEVVQGDRVLASTKLTVLEDPTVPLSLVGTTITGGVPREVKYCFCLRKLASTNFALSVGETRLTSAKRALSFTFRSQYGLLEQFSFLDFKLQETLSDSVHTLSDFILSAAAVQFSRKHSIKKTPKPEEYFEFVGQLSFPKLELLQNVSITGQSLSLTHRVLVYLSDLPFTFSRFMGEFPIDICHTASAEETLETMDSDLMPSFEIDVTKAPRLSWAL